MGYYPAGRLAQSTGARKGLRSTLDEVFVASPVVSTRGLRVRTNPRPPPRSTGFTLAPAWLSPECSLGGTTTARIGDITATAAGIGPARLPGPAGS